MQYLLLTALLTATSLNAWAGGSVGTIPEPGVAQLLAIGAVGGLVVWIRNRKNK